MSATLSTRQIEFDRRVLARMQLPCRRDDLFARKPPSEGAAKDRPYQGSPARSLGFGPRPDLHLGDLNRVIKKYGLDVMYISGPGHGAPACSPTVILKASTRKSIPIEARTRTGCASCSALFLSRRIGVIARREPRARFMRAANSAMPFRMASARLSTTPICSLPPLWATAKRRLARSRPHGTRINFSIRFATAPSFRSSI